MFEKMICPKCEKETNFTSYVRYEEWQNEAIPDEELSEADLRSRQNGEFVQIKHCTECEFAFIDD